KSVDIYRNSSILEQILKKEIFVESKVQQQYLAIHSQLNIGDIILVTGSKKPSKWLVNAQKLYYKKAQSSHVMIHIGDGVIIHATTVKGVHFSPLLEELNDCETTWRVLRNKSLADIDENNLLRSSLKFFNQKYNIKFLEVPEEGADINNTESSFCSELASKFFESLDIRIADHLERKVFPCNFDQFFDSISSNSDWIDVTEIYKEIITLPCQDEYLISCKAAIAHMSLMLMKRQYLAPWREFSYSFIADFAKQTGNQQLSKLSDEMRDKLKNRELDMWFDKDKNFGQQEPPSEKELSDSLSKFMGLYDVAGESLNEIFDLAKKKK
ncbi:YiiX/YebB-like N1pC/P60 family cysteine hydrolase, partial [Acinetobacter baumannii]|nr:hypothetical protein [Acinetobacter baumannii]